MLLPIAYEGEGMDRLVPCMCFFYNPFMSLLIHLLVYNVFSPSDADRVSNLSVCYSTTGLHFTSATQMYTLDMTISWNEPNHTNGDITFYEVTVAQTFNSNNSL